MYENTLRVRSASGNSQKSLDTVSLSSSNSIVASTIWSLENETVKKVPRLNDQQWIMQRKKIGLSRKIKSPKQKDKTQSKKEDIVSFIRNNFKRKECVNYVCDSNSNHSKIRRLAPCYCGATEKEHKSYLEYRQEINNVVKHPTIMEESEEEDSDYDNKHGIMIRIEGPQDWKPSLSFREFPTNAFGNIEFDGRLSLGSKYVRISADSDIKRVKEFIVDQWEMMTPRPRLAIGIVGGAQNFKLEGRKQQTFKSGLIGALKATNGWVLSAGTDTGVMRLVGEAVEEGQFIVTEGSNIRRGIKAIGLVNWGMVEDSADLVNTDLNRVNNVNYAGSPDIRRGQPVPLNPNHTHFLMIDTGYRYTFKGVAPFLTAFEQMVSAPAPGGLGVPVINLIVEGGLGSLYEVHEFLTSGQMLVVVEGTGRMADIISYAYRHASRDANSGSIFLHPKIKTHLKNMFIEAYGDKYLTEVEDKMDRYLSMIDASLKHYNLITVFDIRVETDLDNVILTSLLKGKDLNLYSQLYLALVWDRLDIAEEKIFSNRSFEVRPESLDELMLKALTMERKNFVEALVVNGFSMGNFLTVEVLRELYQDAINAGQPLVEQIEKFVGTHQDIYLRSIHKYILFIWKKHRNILYELDVPVKKRSKEDVIKNSKKNFDQPFFELFVWGLMTQKMNLLDYFWERSGCPTLASIFAASFYEVLIDNFRLDYNVDILKGFSNHWVLRANDLLAVAFKKDKARAVGLVEMPNKRFESHSLMKLAFNGNLRSFITNPVCQESIRINWQRGIVHMSVLPSILAIFFPFLVWTRLFIFLPLGDDGGSLNPFQKMFVFYKAPIVKFYGECISYTLFVVLHTYIALFNYTRAFLIPELVLYVWIIIFLVDDIRQFLEQPARKLSMKLRDHFDNVWNNMDTAIFILAVASVILKLTPGLFSVARVVFATNNLILYFRFLRLFHIRWDIGPKVVIMYRMLPELLSFLVLLIIFILAYGTASQALLNPKSSFHLDNLYFLVENVLWLPYWQMYGELSLDRLKPDQGTCNAKTEECEDLALYSTVIPIFFGFYLLIGNVMLLNLLIAIFTSVYDQVSEHSKEVWRWEMFRLASEYDTKPGLAPPLVIIEDIWKLLKGIWKKTCRRKKEDLEALMMRDLEMLSLFEKDCLHEYLARDNNSTDAVIDNRLTRLEENVQKIVKLLEEPEISYGMPTDDSDDEKSQRLKNHNLSRKIMTAKIRGHTAKTRESLALLERKIDSVNEDTKASLEVIEQSVDIIKDAVGHSKHKKRKKSKH